MSWSNSSLTTDSFPSIALSGSIAVCGGEELDAYYSNNAGQTWSNANDIDGYNVFALSNLNGVAGLNTTGEPPSVMYTTNGGANWSFSNLSGSVNALAISSLNAVASMAGDGLYYSTNGGQTWTQSNITSDDYGCLFMVPSSSIVLAGGSSSNGVLYSTNGGQTWTQSSMTSEIVSSLAVSGVNAVAGTTSSGLFYSSDSGVTWTASSIIYGDWPHVGIDDQNRAIAASTSFPGIYYSTDAGATWTLSNLTSGTFSVSMNNSGAIAAAIADAAGIYYTVDGGQTWTASNFATSTYFNAILSGGNAIASFADGNGMAYSSGPLCFHRNVRLLCDAGPGRRRVYRPIYQLKVGDKVWTHGHGAVRIKHIASAELICGLFSDDATHLYRHKKTGAMITGAHRLLVPPDEMPPAIADEQKRRYGLDQRVDDLAMWMTCLHPDFEKVDTQTTFGSKHPKQQLFHLVLEHDNEPTRHYGVYMNGGVLAETCDEAGFQRMYDSARAVQQQRQKHNNNNKFSSSLTRASHRVCRLPLSK